MLMQVHGLPQFLGFAHVPLRCVETFSKMATGGIYCIMTVSVGGDNPWISFLVDVLFRFGNLEAYILLCIVYGKATVAIASYPVANIGQDR